MLFLMACDPRDVRLRSEADKARRGRSFTQNSGAGFLRSYASSAHMVERQMEALVLLETILPVEGKGGMGYKRWKTAEGEEMLSRIGLVEEIGVSRSTTNIDQWNVIEQSRDENGNLVEATLAGSSTKTVEVRNQDKSKITNVIALAEINRVLKFRQISAGVFQVEYKLSADLVNERIEGDRTYADKYDGELIGTMEVVRPEVGQFAVSNSEFVFTTTKSGEKRSSFVRVKKIENEDMKFDFRNDCGATSGKVAIFTRADAPTPWGNLSFRPDAIKIEEQDRDFWNGGDKLAACPKRPLFDLSRLLR